MMKNQRDAAELARTGADPSRSQVASDAGLTGVERLDEMIYLMILAALRKKVVVIESAERSTH
jgi:hypothetical protein